jgi:hypothetical protein
MAFEPWRPAAVNIGFGLAIPALTRQNTTMSRSQFRVSGLPRWS